MTRNDVKQSRKLTYRSHLVVWQDTRRSTTPDVYEFVRELLCSGDKY